MLGLSAGQASLLGAGNVPDTDISIPISGFLQEHVSGIELLYIIARNIESIIKRNQYCCQTCDACSTPVIFFIVYLPTIACKLNLIRMTPKCDKVFCFS